MMCGGIRACSSLCRQICTVTVDVVNMFPQTLEDLSEEHVTIHLIGAYICLFWMQPAAGYQLLEGLKQGGSVDLLEG